MDDQLKNLVKECQQGLAGAFADPQHPWKLFTVANVDSQGFPQSRYVVLRGLDADRHGVTFFTDQRSSKIADLTQDPSVSLCFFNPDTHLQLVIRGKVSLHNQDDVAQKLWQATPWRSLKCYQMKQIPGEVLPSPFMLNSEDLSQEEAYPFFTVAKCRSLSWDILLLKPEGNQRAVCDFDDGGMLAGANWVAP